MCACIYRRNGKKRALSSHLKRGKKRESLRKKVKGREASSGIRKNRSKGGREKEQNSAHRRKYRRRRKKRKKIRANTIYGALMADEVAFMVILFQPTVRR